MAHTIPVLNHVIDHMIGRNINEAKCTHVPCYMVFDRKGRLSIFPIYLEFSSNFCVEIFQNEYAHLFNSNSEDEVEVNRRTGKPNKRSQRLAKQQQMAKFGGNNEWVKYFFVNLRIRTKCSCVPFTFGTAYRPPGIWC